MNFHTRLLAFLLLFSGITADTTVSACGPPFFSSLISGKKIDVCYFHFTRRNPTDINIEKVAREAVEQQYADKVRTGEVTFQSINLDEKDGEALGTKLKVDGQTLLIISDDKRVDLTDKGMMYASSSPEKLKAEIQKTIDTFLK